MNILCTFPLSVYDCGTPGPLRPRVVAPNRVLSTGQIELFDIQTVRKKMISGAFKNVSNKMYLQIIYLRYIYKHDLA